jgi:hypothetical protein
MFEKREYNGAATNVAIFYIVVITGINNSFKTFAAIGAANELG